MWNKIPKFKVPQHCVRRADGEKWKEGRKAAETSFSSAAEVQPLTC